MRAYGYLSVLFVVSIRKSATSWEAGFKIHSAIKTTGKMLVISIWENHRKLPAYLDGNGIIL